jgi:hypothetical protein
VATPAKAKAKAKAMGTVTGRETSHG